LNLGHSPPWQHVCDIFWLLKVGSIAKKGMDKLYWFPLTASTSAMLPSATTLIESCPRCQCKTFTKNGKDNSKQRYRCKQCAYNFTMAKRQPGIDQHYVALCLKLYLEGMGFRAIERVVGVSHVSVMNWVKKYSKVLTHVVEQEKQLSAVEFDELCSYVGSKK
jgi:transposase-like protein